MKTTIKFTLFIFLFLSPVLVQAQQLTGGYNLSYGKFKMNDLKNLQEKDVAYYQDRYGEMFQYKSMKTFPNRIFHNAYLGLKFSYHEIGLRYDYLTTGGRNHLEDYSGEMKNDMNVKSDALGVYYKLHCLTLPLSKDFSFSTNVGLATGVIYNKLTNDVLFHLEGSVIPNAEDYNREEYTKYYSTNWYIEPNLGFQFWYKKAISLNINVGYLFDNQGKVHTSDVDTYSSFYYRERIAIGSEHNFGVNWTGLRASLGLGFAFSIK